ncbi:ABC transporter permease [Martelella radicis]|uniref:Putative spermidine/putrescine transport system permease protein n=1 Tax=Martelella radicis TaxID=1397476 RepID=A0A7W6P8P9_9HYPH|nr:ABC transporter permease [Martelella radicis]MBB4120925.1 putative spermidine/putrescine transport system permease protein [Martelella radicis]
MKTDRAENALLVSPGLLLLALAFFLPIARMLGLSVMAKEGGFTLDHFVQFLSEPYYLGVLWRTIRLSFIITVISALIGFPLAYIMARSGPRARLWLIIVILLPLMTSVVIRTFGWMVIFERGGIISSTLYDLGLVKRNFTLMRTETAIVIGMVQVLLPFMTLSILGVITRIDQRLEEAARTMGCNFLQSFRHVVLPLSMPGIAAGSLLAFTLSASSFVTPSLLGGPRLQVLASSIYSSVTQTLDWHFAAAQAVILFLGIALTLIPYFRLTGGRHG